MTTNTDITTRIDVHTGPVQEAVLILATAPALRDHLTIETSIGGSGWVLVEHNEGDVPFAMWGSGAQVMWELLLSIASSRHEVSLYAVVSRLDLSNRAAVGAALATLCRP